jgi:hypothetical protein
MAEEYLRIASDVKMACLVMVKMLQPVDYQVAAI